MEFAFKLIKHGGIFLLRVVGILVPALGGAIAAGASANSKPEESAEYGCYPDGTPYYENSAHEQWDLYYGEKG